MLILRKVSVKFRPVLITLSPELVTFQIVLVSFQNWWHFLLLLRLFSGVLEALTWLLCGYFPHRAAGAAVSSSTHPKALTGIQAASSLVQQFQLHSDQTSTTHTVWTVSVGLHSKEVEVWWQEANNEPATSGFLFFYLILFWLDSKCFKWKLSIQK